MIDRSDVLHVARLARLELSDEEVDRMAQELSSVLDYFMKIAELDLEDVPPTSHPLDLVNVWRDDEPRPSLSEDEVFANAPERDDGFFRVPPTTEVRES